MHLLWNWRYDGLYSQWFGSRGLNTRSRALAILRCNEVDRDVDIICVCV